MPRKRVFQIIGVNLALLVVCLGVVETLWRILYADDIRYSLNVMADRAYRFDVSGLYPSTRKVIRYSRDANGFRGHYDAIKDIDLIVVGGSTTDQRFTDDEETWDHVLRTLFQERAGKEVTIVNAGVDGQSTYGHLQNFELWFSRFSDLNPDYILFYVGVNDLYVNDTPLRKDRLTVDDPVRNLVRRSFLYYLFRVIGGILKVEQEEISHRRVDFGSLDTTTVRSMPVHRFEATMREKAEAFATRLRALAHRTNQLGARPIFVTQRRMEYWLQGDRIVGRKTRPGLYNGIDIYHAMKRLNTTMMAVCADVDGLCIDLESELAFSHDDFYDFTHLTPRGARKVGAYLYEKLKDLY